MIKNYFKIAIRNIWKYKTYSAINIIGFAIGLASCLLILLYVNNEISFEKMVSDMVSRDLLLAQQEQVSAIIS